MRQITCFVTCNLVSLFFFFTFRMERSDSCQTYGAVVDRLWEGIECFYKEREVIIGTVGTEDGKVVVKFSQG